MHIGLIDIKQLMSYLYTHWLFPHQECIHVLHGSSSFEHSVCPTRLCGNCSLINTKKGKVGRPAISVKADWGFSDFAMQYRPIISGEERLEYIYNGLKSGQLRDGATEAEAIAYADKQIDKYAPVPWCGYTDWDELLFQKGSHQTYEVSAAGGTEKIKYYSSLSYLKQEGITPNSGLERLSGRVNMDYKAILRQLGAEDRARR